ncbi:Sesquipedalian-1 [Ophiophagus hannah]|uniref:Sesquipedalian n=1 Tax=Ophiophagus hannah TaxID=8665 RepID=V8PCY5_OPHHA|nr:Sesquipedalian-1 [Ophiophagus hannah]
MMPRLLGEIIPHIWKPSLRKKCSAQFLFYPLHLPFICCLIPVFYDFSLQFQSQSATKLHIASILTSSHLDQLPDRQGVLYKKNNRTAIYQRCWCELRGNLLICREQSGERALIVLEGCTVELQESTSEPHTFKICYPDVLPDQSYKMAAEDQETMEDWVRALSTARFEYLRALVTELEGQFCWLKSQQNSKEEASCKATDLPLQPPKLVAQKFSHMDFACLHQEFGKDVKRARKQWQEGKGNHVPERESLMHFI